MAEDLGAEEIASTQIKVGVDDSAFRKGMEQVVDVLSEFQQDMLETMSEKGLGGKDDQRRMEAWGAKTRQTLREVEAELAHQHRMKLQQIREEAQENDRLKDAVWGRGGERYVDPDTFRQKINEENKAYIEARHQLQVNKNAYQQTLEGYRGLRDASEDEDRGGGGGFFGIMGGGMKGLARGVLAGLGVKGVYDAVTGIHNSIEFWERMTVAMGKLERQAGDTAHKVWGWGAASAYTYEQSTSLAFATARLQGNISGLDSTLKASRFLGMMDPSELGFMGAYAFAGGAGGMSEGEYSHLIRAGAAAGWLNPAQREFGLFPLMAQTFTGLRTGLMGRYGRGSTAVGDAVDIAAALGGGATGVGIQAGAQMTQGLAGVTENNQLLVQLIMERNGGDWFAALRQAANGPTKENIAILGDYFDVVAPPGERHGDYRDILASQYFGWNLNRTSDIMRKTNSLRNIPDLSQGEAYALDSVMGTAPEVRDVARNRAQWKWGELLNMTEEQTALYNLLAGDPGGALGALGGMDAKDWLIDASALGVLGLFGFKGMSGLFRRLGARGAGAVGGASARSAARTILYDAYGSPVESAAVRAGARGLGATGLGFLGAAAGVEEYMAFMDKNAAQPTALMKEWGLSFGQAKNAQSNRGAWDALLEVALNESGRNLTQDQRDQIIDKLMKGEMPGQDALTKSPRTWSPGQPFSATLTSEELQSIRAMAPKAFGAELSGDHPFLKKLQEMGKIDIVAALGQLQEMLTQSVTAPIVQAILDPQSMSTGVTTAK